MLHSSEGVTYQQLYDAPNQSTKVLLCSTKHGFCVLKRWLADRVCIGGNRSQPLAEYAALLDLHDVPNINAPLKITLDRSGVDFIYAYCGSNALEWRLKLHKQHDDDDELREEQMEQLAQHVAVHVLLALQEFSTRGLVHRDVKPTNVLLKDFCGFTWLSDMGLTTAAQHLPGFVKGLDFSYLPPEYVTQDSTSKLYNITDDLPALAHVTTTAIDMYQLGLTVYQLIHGSLPSQLVPRKGMSLNPERLSEVLRRVALFDWRKEISRNIANADAAELLEALLRKEPQLRPTPQAALEFPWLRSVLPAALRLLEQQRQQWPGMQQQALLAAKHMELVHLQQDIADAVAGSSSSGNGSSSGNSKDGMAAAGQAGDPGWGCCKPQAQQAAQSATASTDNWGCHSAVAGAAAAAAPLASSRNSIRAAVAAEWISSSGASSVPRSYANAVTATAPTVTGQQHPKAAVDVATPTAIAAADTWGHDESSSTIKELDVYARSAAVQQNKRVLVDISPPAAETWGPDNSMHGSGSAVLDWCVSAAAPAKQHGTHVAVDVTPVQAETWGPSETSLGSGTTTNTSVWCTTDSMGAGRGTVKSRGSWQQQVQWHSCHAATGQVKQYDGW